MFGNQLKVRTVSCKIMLTIINMHIVSWNDLIKIKPDGIEESIQSASISLALFGEFNINNFGNSENSGNSDDIPELKEDDLIVEVQETGSGNLNISWKLKQILGITVLKYNDMIIIY